MKEVKAYVHRSRVADVIAALKDCPAWGSARAGRRHNLAVYVVKGSLLPLDSGEQHFSMDLGDEVVNEYKLEMLCEDNEVDAIVAALKTSAHTGQAVAGWITVTEVVQAIAIHRIVRQTFVQRAKGLPMNRLFAPLLIAFAIALPASAAEDHAPKHGGVVIETKAGDLELVVKPELMVIHVSDHGKPAVSARFTLK